jgi:hypothetical protein
MADTYTTYQIVKVQSPSVEGMPLPRYFMETTSIGYYLFVINPLMSLVALLILLFFQKYKIVRLAYILFTTINIVVVLSNTVLMLGYNL